MMNRKNLFRMAALSMVAVCMAACSGSDDVTAEAPQPEQPVTGKNIVFEGVLGPKGGTTRSMDANGVTRWELGDRIAIIFKSASAEHGYDEAEGTVISVDNNGQQAIFRCGNLPGAVNNTEVKLIYPFSRSDHNPNNRTYQLNGITSQRGTYEDISQNWDVATATDTLLVEGNSAHLKSSMINMENQLCVCKFSLTDEDMRTLNTRSLTMTVGSTSYSISNLNAESNTFYVALPPMTNKDVTFTATSSEDDNVYSRTYTSQTLAKGVYYPSTLRLYGQHDAADLGIVVNGKRILWARTNLGAKNPTEVGSYFSWGERWDKDNGAFAWNTYLLSNGESYMVTKYCPSSAASHWAAGGEPDDLEVLLPEDDAANYRWGNDWYMPTYEEAMALADTKTNGLCNWIWQTDFGGTTGLNGFVVASTTTGDWIFLPASGLISFGRTRSNYGKYGYFWTATRPADAYDIAYSICFYHLDNGGESAYSGNMSRIGGLPIRPIKRQ